ncbi:MAG: YfhO family protein [Acidobacteriota bacterium]
MKSIISNNKIYFYLIFSAAFIFIILFLFNGVFFSGKVIVPGDIPFNTPLWQGEAQELKYYKAQNYLLSDQINQFYVWHFLAHSGMKTPGGLPLWNPYIFAGQPLVANAQSSLFYPPNLLLYFFTPGIVATIRAIFHLFIVALFSYLLGRKLNISVAGSVLMSAAFMLSGPVIAWLGHPHANVFVWLPFLLWSCEHILTGDRKLKWGSISAIGIGMSILGGHPETTFHLLMIFSLYFILRLLFTDKTGKKKIRYFSHFLLIILTGFLIGSIQMLPFAGHLFNSATLAEGGRGVNSGIRMISENGLEDPATSVTLLIPNFYGNPVDRSYNWPFSIKQNYNEQAIYFGMIPFMFAIASLFIRKKPVQLKIIISLSFFSLAVAWRLPFFELFNHLPVFSIVSNGRLRIFFTLLFIVSAGYGFDAVKDYFKGNNENKRVFSGSLIVPSLIILIFSMISLLKTYYLLIGSGGGSGLFSSPFIKYLLFRIFAPGEIRTMISLFVVLLLLTFYLFYYKKKLTLNIFSVLLVFLTIAELFILSLNYNTEIKEEHILPKTYALEQIKKGSEPFRIISDEKIMFHNYNAIHGIQVPGGYDLPVNKSFSEMYRKQGGGDIHSQNWSDEWPFIDLLNVKYFMKKGKGDPIKSKFKLIYDNYNYRIYENTAAYPRAFMVYRYEVIKNREKLLEEMVKKDFILKDMVFLEEDLSDEMKSNMSDAEPGTGKVEFIRYGNNRVEMEVFTSRAGILFFSDQFAPGWNVTVDNKKSKIMRADYSFRGVSVSRGSHKIIFYYTPLLFIAGKYLTLAGILIVLLFFVFRRRK